MNIFDSNNPQDEKSLKANLDELAKENKNFKFDLSEFKKVLSEFKCVEDKDEISKLEQIVDSRKQIGEPDYVFIVEAPVMITIHLDKGVYALTQLMPNPRPNAKLPFVYTIQVIALCYYKDELPRVNNLIKSYREYKRQKYSKGGLAS